MNNRISHIGSFWTSDMFSVLNFQYNFIVYIPNITTKCVSFYKL